MCVFEFINNENKNLQKPECIRELNDKKRLNDKYTSYYWMAVAPT